MIRNQNKPSSYAKVITHEHYTPLESREYHGGFGEIVKVYRAIWSHIFPLSCQALSAPYPV